MHLPKDRLNEIYQFAIEKVMAAGSLIKDYYNYSYNKCESSSNNNNIKDNHPHTKISDFHHQLKNSDIFNTNKKKTDNDQLLIQPKVFQKGGDPTDLVTSFDRQIESFLKKELMDKFPQFGFIGEETGITHPFASMMMNDDISHDVDPKSINTNNKNTHTTTISAKANGQNQNTTANGHFHSHHRQPKYFWVVDPIDGTTNFVHKFSHSCISLALIVDNEPVIGIIYQPYYDQIYTAMKGCGAYLNGIKKLSVSSVSELKNSLICTEYGIEWKNSSFMNLLFDQRRKLCEVPVHGIRSLGSAALNICAVALGQFDIYYQYGIHAWDIAAGILILLESGGHLVSLSSMSNRFLSSSSSENDNDHKSNIWKQDDLSKRSVLVSSSPLLSKEFLNKIILTTNEKDAQLLKQMLASFEPDILQ